MDTLPAFDVAVVGVGMGAGPHLRSLEDLPPLEDLGSLVDNPETAALLPDMDESGDQDVQADATPASDVETGPALESVVGAPVGGASGLRITPLSEVAEIGATDASSTGSSLNARAFSATS